MTITAPPVVPGFTEPVPDFNIQGDIEFSDNAQRMVNELPPFHEGMQEMAEWMHDTGEEVETLAGQTVAQADVAVAARNEAVAARNEAVPAGAAAVAAAEVAEDARDDAVSAKNATEALFVGITPAGSNFLAMPTPDGPRFVRVNADGSVDRLTAGDFLLAIGASSGMANPMIAPGDLIIGGAAGEPARLAKGGNASIFGVDNSGNPGYLAQTASVFDFGFAARHRTVSANVSANASFNINLAGGSHVTPGRSYWVNSSVTLGTHPEWPSGQTLYRLDDYLIVDGTSKDVSGRYQVATVHVSNDAHRDAAFQQIRYKTHDTASDWGAWKRIGSSESVVTSPVQTYTANDQVSNNITINLACDEYNFHVVNCNGDPLPSTAGSYIINLNDLPDATSSVVSGHINARRLGRKSTVTIQSSGYTINWIGTPAFQGGANGVDLIHYYISPLQPTVIRLSQIDSRAS